VRINHGDRIGFVGRNGAGKSTLAKVLAGENLPAGGAVQRTGKIGYLPQDPRTGEDQGTALDRILSARDLDQIAARMTQVENEMAQAWLQKQVGSPLKTPYELLILASIVEKETGRSGDRGLVAAVFINRLNKGMLLQTDPTVIYGIGPKFDGNLRKADLRKDRPYKT
jgi:hypothetical protein